MKMLKNATIIWLNISIFWDDPASGVARSCTLSMMHCRVKPNVRAENVVANPMTATMNQY